VLVPGLIAFWAVSFVVAVIVFPENAARVKN
jgi:hypothetical protein